jgi:hypothetical protein
MFVTGICPSLPSALFASSFSFFLGLAFLRQYIVQATPGTLVAVIDSNFHLCEAFGKHQD